jgi:hypothetical protein
LITAGLGERLCETLVAWEPSSKDCSFDFSCHRTMSSESVINRTGIRFDPRACIVRTPLTLFWRSGSNYPSSCAAATPHQFALRCYIVVSEKRHSTGRPIGRAKRLTHFGVPQITIPATTRARRDTNHWMPAGRRLTMVKIRVASRKQ